MAVTKAVTAITTEMWGKEELVSTLGSQQQTRNNSLYRLQMAKVIKDFYDSFDDTNYVLIVLYIVIIALALISNILVIIVVFKYQYMRSVTNYFVVNLSVADLLVTIICMPMSISQAVTIIWVYGELMCKLFYYLQGVAVAASVFTFTTMSIDRYLAIRSPIGFRQRFNRKVTIIIIGVLWAVSLSIFIPVLKLVILRNVSAELWNITLTSPDVNGEILEVLKPPNYYVCLEDFESLGVDSYIFGVGYFTCVYAIPGKLHIRS
ncbi:orexin receptor type 1-like [Copidosoma floridanum]|uniref:orexin receptor type 1-like n=1 Tax=Copidosoma floridanum TaxID=29053 RepID=UPI0006C9A6EE|nr:orexin receptor type 1-like [Copidosoma floridanum]